MSDANSWRAGKTTAERGYNARWQRVRRHYLREHPVCVYCLRRGISTPATVVDHIKPHEGDMSLFWDEANWQAMCKSCHDTDKAEQEGRHKPKARIGLDGWPLSVAIK